MRRASHSLIRQIALNIRQIRAPRNYSQDIDRLAEIASALEVSLPDQINANLKLQDLPAVAYKKANLRSGAIGIKCRPV